MELFERLNLMLEFQEANIQTKYTTPKQVNMHNTNTKE